MSEESIWSRLPFRVGDVLVFDDGEEAWLAGASIFSEDAPMAALFRAPRGGSDFGVYLRAVPPVEAFLLAFRGVERGPIEPPSSLEEGGVLYTRVRRLPVHVSREGESSFDLEGVAILGEYRGLGDKRLLRIGTTEAVMVLIGRLLLPGTYDRMPGRGD